MNNDNKLQIYNRVAEKVKASCGDGVSRACLYWTYFTKLELAKAKVCCCWQAGDCFWPRIRREDVDRYPPGESTHFGYQWSPTTRLSRLSNQFGHLPEVHVWAGIVATQEIVDFTTQFFPRRCQELLHYDWPGERPPLFYWGGYHHLPDGVRYLASYEATVAVARQAEDLFDESKGGRGGKKEKNG